MVSESDDHTRHNQDAAQVDFAETPGNFGDSVVLGSTCQNVEVPSSGSSAQTPGDVVMARAHPSGLDAPTIHQPDYDQSDATEQAIPLVPVQNPL